MSEDLSNRMRAVSTELRQIASEYDDMKFTASEEAMNWPLVLLVDEDGEAAVWCGKTDCPLDGHNARILDLSLYKSGTSETNLDEFTPADLLTFVVGHIESIKERFDALS